MLRKDRKSMYWGVAPCCADIIFVPKIKNLEDVFGVQQPLLSTRSQQGATISPVLPKGLVLNMFVFLCTLQRLLQIHQKGAILCEVHLNFSWSEHITTCIKEWPHLSAKQIVRSCGP